VAVEEAVAAVAHQEVTQAVHGKAKAHEKDGIYNPATCLGEYSSVAIRNRFNAV
jgi:hypothetical protein